MLASILIIIGYLIIGSIFANIIKRSTSLSIDGFEIAAIVFFWIFLAFGFIPYIIYEGVTYIFDKLRDKD